MREIDVSMHLTSIRPIRGVFFRKGLIMVLAYVLLGIAAIIAILGIVSMVIDGEGLFGFLLVAGIFAAFGFNAYSNASAADGPLLSPALPCKP